MFFRSNLDSSSEVILLVEDCILLLRKEFLFKLLFFSERTTADSVLLFILIPWIYKVRKVSVISYVFEPYIEKLVCFGDAFVYETISLIECLIGRRKNVTFKICKTTNEASV